MLNKCELAIGQTLRKLMHVNRFESAVDDPRKAQEQRLLKIIRQNEDTAFGHKHGFRKISSIADYQAIVPPCTYEDIYPYIKTVMSGGKAQLTSADPIMFACTSGTTSQPKFIPVTPEHLSDYTHAFQIHNYQMIVDHPRAASGRFLIISSNDEEGTTDSGIPCGAISGLLNRRQPSIIRKHFALPYQLSRLKDVNTKYYMMLRIAAAQNITAILCCNPSSLLLLAEQLHEHAPGLVRDIADGRADRNYAIPQPHRDACEPYLRPNRRASELLFSALERDGLLCPRNVWPGLRLISCWKGGPMGFYLSQLPEAYGDVPVRDFGYMASEGRGSIPLSDDGAGGVLAVTSHFFEFVPELDVNRKDCRFLTVDELEANGRYYIYFTTASGLYRYNISDLVEVVGFYRKTPIIAFVRKGAGFSSITGEKLTEEQVRVALAQAVRKLKLTEIAHFVSAVQLDRPPYYTCFMETKGPMEDLVRRQFLRIFDLSLKLQNPEYRDKRDGLRLGEPKICLVPPGTYTRLRQKRVMEGAPEAQVKIPMLVQGNDSILKELRRAV